MLTLRITEIKQTAYGRKVYAKPYLLPPTDAEVTLGDEVTLDLGVDSFKYATKADIKTCECEGLLTYAGTVYPVVRKDSVGEYVYLQEVRVPMSVWHNQANRANFEPTSGFRYAAASDVMVCDTRSLKCNP
jgi:hypothetical protein